MKLNLVDMYVLTEMSNNSKVGYGRVLQACKLRNIVAANAEDAHQKQRQPSKLAGTERGITEPQPTFSTLFGEPFMPMDPSVYANMLGERIEKYNTKVYLVNTGWTGGPYGVGSRMKLKYTRAMVTAALNGTFDDVEHKHDEVFNVDIPQTCPNLPSEIMNPRDTWADKAAYDAQAKKLAKMFQDNFTKKYPNMPKNIAEAGPKAD